MGSKKHKKHKSERREKYEGKFNSPCDILARKNRSREIVFVGVILLL